MTLRIRFHDWIDQRFGLEDHAKVDEQRAHEHLYGDRQSTMIQWPILPATQSDDDGAMVGSAGVAQR